MGLRTAMIIASAFAMCTSQPRAAGLARDAVVENALSAVEAHRDCAAHAALRSIVGDFPHGLYAGDELFLRKRYAEAFAAYLPLVDAQHVADDEIERRTLITLIGNASHGRYPGDLHHTLIDSGASDLASLVLGEIAYVQGRRSSARALWLSGVGAHNVPGGSSPYVGASISILVLLDRSILLDSCRKRSKGAQ